MLSVFQDNVYSQLHPKTREKLELAINRIDQLHTQWAIVSNLLINQINSAQTFTWRGFNSPQGRALSKEIDRYPKCSNMRY